MEVGTKLVCISEGNWHYRKRDTWFFGLFKKKQAPANGPKKDEIVTFQGYGCERGFILIREYLIGQYDERCFRPLISNEELQKELSSITVPNPIHE